MVIGVTPRRGTHGLVGRGVCVRAFTLMELLVTVAIVGILVALVLPLLSKTMGASRGFKCQQALRSVAYDFAVFSDDNLHGFRGDTEGGAFTLENFVESQYSVHEFWAWPGEIRRDIPDGAGYDPMRCPDVKGPLTLRANIPCSAGAVAPTQNVSYGFNVRLRIAEVLNPTPRQVPLTLTSGVTLPDSVPLVWDVDGSVAAAQGELPFFSGPSLDSPAVFAGDRYWFPGMRHVGSANFAFIDGHVQSSSRPLEEPTWDWGFSPRR
jgi:prepilin-type N-terminal cleavage/methylation domain-containing protein/prepilin-type processing-associated H-X9-DG protein